jgi:hypothetical protein
MTRQDLIDELDLCIKQIKDLGDLDKQVKVFHSVCTGGYSGDCEQIDQFELNFTNEEDGEVVLMSYAVCEI